MAINLILTLVLVQIVSASLNQPSWKNEEISVAVQEMQSANYFTFVTLMNMVQDRLPRNSTFFVPSDKTLSKALIPQDKVLEFLRRHSIPSPLLFDDLRHLPSGTVIPTYFPHYSIRISNGVLKEFYLNNVQLVNPNICTQTSSFRCHGIKDSLRETSSDGTAPSCGTEAQPTTAIEPSTPPTYQPTPAEPPSDDNYQNGSSATSSLSRGYSAALVSCVILITMKVAV